MNDDIEECIAKKLLDVKSRNSKRTYSMGYPSKVELNLIEHKGKYLTLVDFVGM